MKKEKKTKKNQVRILLDKSREFGMASKFSQSVEYAQAAVDLAIQADDKLLEAEAYYNIGLMSGYLNQYDVSLEYQLKALKIHEAQKMSRMIAEDWNNIGYVYLQLKEYDRALESYRKSISNNPDSPRPYTNMSIIYKNLNKYEEALESADKARAIAIRIDNNRSIVLADLNIAEILKHLKQYDKALSSLYEAEEKLKNDEPELLLAITLDRAEVYLFQGNINKSLDLMRSLETDIEAHENKNLLVKLYKLISNAYKSNGDFEKALSYMEKSIEGERKIFDRDMMEKVIEIQSRYELEIKELRAREMTERAAKLASLAVMSGGITHEINQPLCAIKVTAESMMMWNENNPYLLPHNFPQRLDMIISSSNRIYDIIQHMRSFWQTEDREGSEICEISAAVENALALNGKQLLAHLINTKIDKSESEIFINIRKIHLEQIIINLIVNAMHALDEIDKNIKEINISISAEDGLAYLAISDNGPGIDKCMINQIFDPFFSTKTQGKGMGLGLAIVKNYCDLYNGKIAVSNNIDGGACFLLTFPLQKES